MIVNLIGHTKTREGLRIQAERDNGQYGKGIEVTDDELDTVNIQKDPFHGDWNYTIRPR